MSTFTGLSMLTGFAPWIIFWVLTGNNTFREAAVAALVAAAVGFAVERVRAPDQTVKLFDLVTLAWFAVLSVLAFVASDAWLNDWSFALSNLVLLGIAVGSVLGGVPFTIQYAKDTTPREYWGNATFTHINVVLTWVWAAAFAIMSASSLALILMPDERSYDTYFNWVIPIGASVLAMKITKWYPDHAGTH